ncbi:MAG: ATP-binding protein [Patescibacteria group bacterium]
MDIFLNLDLLVLGIVIAGIAVIGAAVFLTNYQNKTYRYFFYFLLITIVWSLLSYQSYLSGATLGNLRAVIFVAVWHSFLFFQFCFVFPKESIALPFWYKYMLIPYIIGVSVLTLTPAVFLKITEYASDGTVLVVENGGGIAIFGITVFLLILGGIFILVKKYIQEVPEERKQLRFILIGVVITFTLLVTFSFVLPAIFQDARFFKHGVLALIPFIALTFYAIYKHKLFNIKVVSTAFLVFLVTVFSISNILFSETPISVTVNTTAFLIILIGSIHLISDMLKLERANEEKAEFISFASHELRTPLTVIKGYSSMMLDGDFGELNQNSRDALQKILVKSNEAVSLIGQYLNKSKMELGQLRYNLSTFDMGNLVRLAGSEFGHNADQKGITINYTNDNKESYAVNADEGKIKEVVANLIDNAVKYTPKGSVDIYLSRTNDKILLKISDTGVGISSESYPLLFKKFGRLKGTEKAGILGTGLGLYLAHTFITAHKGRIWAESKGDGEGSTFFIELDAFKNTSIAPEMS